MHSWALFCLPHTSVQVFNKGTAHPLVERERLGLRGLLPPRVLTMEQQVTVSLHLSAAGGGSASGGGMQCSRHVPCAVPWVHSDALCRGQAAHCLPGAQKVLPGPAALAGRAA